MLARLVTSLTAVVLIVYGVIAAISPLPLGVPLIVLGLIMIAGANPAARPVIKRMRRKWHWFDVIVRQLGTRTPKTLQATLEETDPGEEDETIEGKQNQSSGTE